MAKLKKVAKKKAAEKKVVSKKVSKDSPPIIALSTNLKNLQA